MGNVHSVLFELQSGHADANVPSNTCRVCEEQLQIEMSRQRFAALFSLAEDAVAALVATHNPATRVEHRKSACYRDAADFIAVSIASLPSSLMDCVGLIERGLYTEAAILNRSLTDLLITISYLQRNPCRADGALRWIRNNPSRIKVFYEAVMPGLYDLKYLRYRRKLFRNVSSANHEIDAKRNSTARVSGRYKPALRHFEEETCQVVLDELLVLLLCWFRVCPPGGLGSPFAIRKLEPGERKLREFFSRRIDLRDEQAAWHLLSRPLPKSVTSEGEQKTFGSVGHVLCWMWRLLV